MKNTVKNIILMLIFIFTINICNNVSLATVSMSVTSNKSEVNPGETFTVTIKVSGGEGYVNISAENGKVDKTYEWIGNNSLTVNCTAGSSGTVKINVSGTIADSDTANDEKKSGSVSVNIKSATNSSNSNDQRNGTTGENTTASKSNEARLKNLGIKPNDFSGFKKDTTDYSVEIPSNVSKVNVYATPLDSKAKVTGTGDVSLNEGESKKVTITVTAEAGNTKTYALTIKRKKADETETQTQGDSDASLKSLGIKPEKYDFSGFKKDKTQYTVKVPKDVEEIEIYAEATSSKAKVVGTGKTQLKTGKNNLVVQVTAEHGTTQTYTIEVTRGETEASATTTSNSKKDEFGLSSLEVEGLTLNPSFETGTYEYKVDLTEDLSSLDINAIATDDDTTVEILGNEELALGENTITILVRNEKEDKTATYQIIVNKNLSEKEKMSWLKPSTWGREEIIKIIIIAVLIILVVIAVILKIKIAKEKNEEEDLEFPGGEELDKALAEHQVLSETAEMQMNSEFENMGHTEETDNLDSSYKENKTGEFDETNYIEDIARSKNYQMDYLNDDFNNKNVSRKKGKHF